MNISEIAMKNYKKGTLLKAMIGSFTKELAKMNYFEDHSISSFPNLLDFGKIFHFGHLGKNSGFFLRPRRAVWHTLFKHLKNLAKKNSHATLAEIFSLFSRSFQTEV